VSDEIDADIHEILEKAKENLDRSASEPNFENLNEAIFRLVAMRFRLVDHKLLTRDENRDLNTAFGVVIGHLKQAYPGFKIKGFEK